MDDPKEYTVGWICGLLIEFIAAKAFLDETYQSPPEIAHHDSGDIVYALGKIARHNVVIAVSLNGGNKPGSSAVVAKRMLNSFPHVRIGLMVGIGSGVPSPEHDVRLGDVVVGSSVRGEGGIVQYSFNRPTQSQDASFEQTMPVNQPPVALQAAVSTLERQYGLKYLQLERRIEEASAKRGYLQDYARPNSHSDKPPGSSILHPTSADEYSGESRENSTYPVKETPKDKSQIHYGLIASSTQIMDNATMRDQLAKNTNILCYETEAADLSNDFPCLVIRGICDYNEAQRNKKWRGFAAMVAAAYTTELLRFVSPRALDADNIPSGLLGKGKRGPMNHDTTMTKIAMITTRNDHDVNEQRGEYGNALRAVARQDRASMAAGSFGEDADFDPPSGQYGNAFKAALKGGHGPDRYGAGAALKRSRNDLFQTWLGEAYLNENARRSLRFQWEIPAVYEKMRRKSLPSDGSDVLDLLSGFIVLTGAGETFECSTCSDFLHRRWRYAGSIALRIMSIGIRQLRFGEMISSDLLQHKDPTAKHFDMDGFLVQNSTTREIEVRFNTYGHEAREVIAAMTWISTAMRPTPSTPTSTSPRLFWSTSLSHELGSSLRPLEEWHPVASPWSSFCWTKLFDTGVIASCFILRDWGKGLEMSFDMMVHLAAVENYHSLNKGIVLLGFATALIPVERCTSSKSIQWHFEAVEDPMGGFIEPSKLPIQGTSQTFQDKAEFQGSKCFIGWFEEAHVLLGTEKLLGTTSMTWSQTVERPRTLHQTGVEGGGQMVFSAGPISFAPQGMATFAFISNVQRFEPTQQYRQSLHACRRRVALIIDAETKQAWLVPILSLILHLCHMYWMDVNKQSRKKNPIPFAKPAHDGHRAVLDAIEMKGDVVVLGTLGEPDTETLRQLFLRIHASLTQTAETREEPRNNTILATELMAIIDTPFQGSALREVDASGSESLVSSWKAIVKHVDVVGVCAKLGSAIEPLIPPSIPMCSTCCTLPAQRYYLAAHMQCLLALSKTAKISTNSLRNGCQLGPRTFWCTESSPWSSCTSPGHARIRKDNTPYEGLQYISTKKPRENLSTVTIDQVKDAGIVVTNVVDTDVVDTGVVVFGREHIGIEKWLEKIRLHWTR